MKKKLKDRIYVCHTYYHVYVTFLKELNRPKEEQGKATLVLSKLSNNSDLTSSLLFIEFNVNKI